MRRAVVGQHTRRPDRPGTTIALTGRARGCLRPPARRRSRRRWRACDCRPDDLAGRTPRPQACRQDAARARASRRQRAIRSGRSSFAGIRNDGHRGLIIGGEREHQRALAAQLRHRCRRLARAHPRRPASAPGSRAPAPPALPRRARPRRRPPACRRPRGSLPAAGFAVVEHRDRGPRRGKPPGNAEADDAGADDDNARPAADRCDGVNSLGQRGSLRWYDPDR